MIATLTTGTDFYGALRYDLVTKKSCQGKHILLDASGVCMDFDEDLKMILTPKDAAFDFKIQAKYYKGRNPIRKPLYHWMLSYHPNDIVADEQMLEDALEFLSRVGFEDVQYVITAHKEEKHNYVSMITNVVNNQGQRISTYKLINKAHNVAADITKKRQYIWGGTIK